MLDEQCFEITYINDPMEVIEEASDVLAVLNKVCVAAYESNTSRRIYHRLKHSFWKG